MLKVAHVHLLQMAAAALGHSKFQELQNLNRRMNELLELLN